MAKITRKTQKIFGASAGVNQISQYGSLAAGAPAYTTDPETIQALSEYLEGWFSAVLGANSPAIEDMNAICYLFGYQLSYIMQAGVAEWDDGTTYYIGSLANDGAGNIYASITNDNLNNALTDTAEWKLVSGSNVVSLNPATQSPYTLTASDYNKIFLVNTANGAMTFNLPAASLNFSFTVKDSAGSAGTNNITIARAGSESIEGVAASYTAGAAWGSWRLVCDGTNWFII
jgi:hypothetical protein